MEIPNSVKSIGESAFENCSGLTSVTIGNGVSSIGEDAFMYCNKLVEVYNLSDLSLRAGDSDYGKVAYYAKNVYTQVDGESWIVDTEEGYRFFYDINEKVGYLLGYCGTDTTLTLPESFTAYDGTLIDKYEIYQYAFENCSGLTSVEIPDSVTSIGDCAFRYCRSLLSVTIGNGVTSIGSYAFSYCNALTSVEIPDSVTSISDYAFRYCRSLLSVTIGNGVTSIGSYAFENCSGLTSVEIPDSVTSIGSYAFSWCSSLKSITIPDSVTSMGGYVFNYCRSLTVYCEAQKEPSGWSLYWNYYSKCPVIWGYKGVM